MRRATFGVLLPLAIAGCLGLQSDLPAEEFTSGTVESWQQALDGQGCQTVRAYFMVEAQRADRWLPPGFWPADAERTPPAFVTIREGRVPALLSSTECRAGVLSEDPFSFGYAGFQVRHPTVADVSQDASHDFYIVTAFSDNPVIRAELEAAGWPANGYAADTIVEAAASELGMDEAYLVSLQIAQGDDMVAQVAGEAFYPTDEESPRLVRTWHASATGLAYLETTPQSAATLGSIRECAIESGTTIADVIGPVGCMSGAGPMEQMTSSASRWIAATSPGDLPIRLVVVPGWQP